jgi:polyisoprenoid-binding protein YceI
MALIDRWPLRILVLAAGMAGVPAMALPLTYIIAPSSTAISFSVDILGLTTAEGMFRNFTGSLTLDVEHPDLISVSISLDTGSAFMGWEPAESMVLGEAYLDAEHYPKIEFSSQSAVITGKDKIRMEGLLTLRGVSHRESFDAELVDRHFDSAKGAEVADFAAIGSVHRSDYRMEADHSWLDDRVVFTIHSTLLLAPQSVPAP